MASDSSSSGYDLLQNITPMSIQNISLSPAMKVFSLSFNGFQPSLLLSNEVVTYLETQTPSFLTSLQALSPEETPGSTLGLIFYLVQFLLDRSAPPVVLSHLLEAVETVYLEDSDIHPVLASLSDSVPARQAILRTYYAARAGIPKSSGTKRSGLWASAANGQARVMLVFGGQGAMNPICVDELAELYNLYEPWLRPLIATVSPVLRQLCQDRSAASYHLHREIDLLTWLLFPASRPPRHIVQLAPVSLPIIGLYDLAQYIILCKLLDEDADPGVLQPLLTGITGHSQGVVVAAAVAAANSWESFYAHARWAVELLFWLGYECHTANAPSRLSPSAVADHVDHGDGIPSWLLSVGGLSSTDVQALVTDCNRHLATHEQLSLGLVNAHENCVVTGPPSSLRGLSLRLRDLTAEASHNQTRLPFRQRKPVIHQTFVPVSAPFHSDHLRHAAQRVKARFADANGPDVSTLRTAVFHTRNGCDIRGGFSSSTPLVDILVDAVACEPVNWPAALQVGAATMPSHVIVLGGGRMSELVRQNLDGYGVRVINGKTSFDPADGKAFYMRHSLLLEELSPPSWRDIYRPVLVPGSTSGKCVLETRLSRLLSAPPILTAGMTPTTVPYDFVAAVMQAGYHIELAGGGYFSAAMMTSAIENLAANIPPGRGITCNLIYINPFAIAFQIPLIRKLIQRGIPIDGLTIGAGVPSREVASEYIQTLGLKHIAFKPGSMPAIQEVIAIAREHPSFPIILQWTGGRGGGHHSFEDFHVPLLQTYSKIRQCPNLYLVVGSGFGDSKGTYPYLNGNWSHRFGYPSMPCDGILLGSRMMVAREAHTSPQAKALILQASGVDDAEWEQSYKRPTGGVITVTSEMGEPIHKLATRGVRLWSDLDKTIFNLPRAQRVAALSQRKEEIIHRLNADFAKPWFGCNSAGDPAEIADMTYSEVLGRLIELMYVKYQQRWVDLSYCDLVHDFVSRSRERLEAIPLDEKENLDFRLLPEQAMARFNEILPEASTRLLHPDDARFFISSCKKPGRKPVNFIPALDEDFEYWFKKDSLWQSEDVDAVIGQDAERVCILQGPVAVRHSTRSDESAQEILDGIHHGLIDQLRADDGTSMPAASHQPEKTTRPPANVDIQTIQTGWVFRPAHTDLPEVEEWLAYLAGHLPEAMRALLEHREFLWDRQRRPNVFRDMLAPRFGQSVQVDGASRELVLRDDASGNALVRVYAGNNNNQEIVVEMYQFAFVSNGPATLSFTFEYHPEGPFLTERLEGRNTRIQSFYLHLWLGMTGNSDSLRSHRLADPFVGKEVTLSSDLLHKLQVSLGHAIQDIPTLSPDGYLPMEVAVIAAWDVLMQPLLVEELQGDLLRLVHRSNTVSYMPEVTPLRVNDVVRSESNVLRVQIKEGGKSVIVEAKIFRDGHQVVTVTAEFFIQGRFTDYEATFAQCIEPDMELQIGSSLDEEILRDREWLHLAEPSTPLINTTLVFHLSTMSKWQDQSTQARVQTSGRVSRRRWNGREEQIGTVQFDAAQSHGNPVMDFLQRRGKLVVPDKIPLKQTGWIDEHCTRTVKIPPTSDLYASLSGDRNPLHLSPLFALLAGQQDTITHGMYTAAVSRAVVEELVANGETERIRHFSVSFLQPVFHRSELTVVITHEAMRQGRMVLSVTVSCEGDMVLQGEAEIDQPVTAYVFTGQGSQTQNMGMMLYESSTAARRVWDEADEHIRSHYGWSVLHLVRNNPQKITIHFRGPQGRRIRDNYLAMTTEVKGLDGSTRQEPVIRDLTAQSTSYTFFDARGLLYATQFAQPTVMLVEKAAFADLQAQGLVQEKAVFAGHSLGEYGALASMAEFLPFHVMLSVVFYRGLVMQFAMQRDPDGQTGFSMAAVSPSRVGPYFDETALRVVVDLIARTSGSLLEIVNFNVEGEQYVCAGEVRNLHVLMEILNFVANPRNDGVTLTSSLQTATDPQLSPLGQKVLAEVTLAQSRPNSAPLIRGRASIPLEGINVPFHSTHLRSGVAVYRRFLEERIKVDDVPTARLVGKFIPNVMGRPFAVDREYLKAAAAVTGSGVLQELSQMA